MPVTAVDIAFDTEFGIASFAITGLLADARRNWDPTDPLRDLNPALKMPCGALTRGVKVKIGSDYFLAKVNEAVVDFDAPFSSTEKCIELCLYDLATPHAIDAKYVFPVSALDAFDGSTQIKGYKYTL